MLANHPQSVALFFALSLLDVVTVVLPAEPASWRTEPAIPPGTPLFVPPALGELAPGAAGAGLVPHVLPRVAPVARVGDLPFLTAPGVVLFTSGSTGAPKPVYHELRGLVRQVEVTAALYGLPRGAGVAASLPLATHFGLGHALLLPTVLGGTVGLLARFDHRSLLDLFASGRYHYWAGTPLMADLLQRAPLSAPAPPAPPVCHVSAGPLPARVAAGFARRFGAPLRPSYGRTEMGMITAADTAPATWPRDTIGRVVAGVELAVGDDPGRPAPPGAIGPIWLRGPWHMGGYGFPPRLEPPPHPGGWWPTQDLGSLDDAGYLVLAGRADDCFKTAGGYLASPGHVARALESDPRVAEAVILPVPAASGPLVGAVVTGARGLAVGDVQAIAARTLPPWLRPARIALSRALPRLRDGKVDRRACLARLTDGG